jgi:hypothetical protein
MNKERLLKLATFLDTVPAEKFDLKDWRRSGGEVEEGNLSSDVTDEQLLGDCGTTACAFGWACTMPEFQALGLHYDGGTPCLVYNTGQRGSLGHPRYYAWDAIAELFDLGSVGRSFLFSGHTYPDNGKGVAHVAARIRRVVEVGVDAAWAEYRDSRETS